MSTVAPITIVHGRHDHLANQAVIVRDGTRHPDLWVVVAMNDPTLTMAGACVLHLDTDLPGLPLAAARNLGARHAISLGADVLVFLDVDCLPGPRLAEASAAAVDDAPDVVWSGVVTYLPPPPDRGYALTGRCASHSTATRGNASADSARSTSATAGRTPTSPGRARTRLPARVARRCPGVPPAP